MNEIFSPIFEPISLVQAYEQAWTVLLPWTFCSSDHRSSSLTHGWNITTKTFAGSLLLLEPYLPETQPDLRRNIDWSGLIRPQVCDRPCLSPVCQLWFPLSWGKLSHQPPSNYIGNSCLGRVNLVTGVVRPIGKDKREYVKDPFTQTVCDKWVVGHGRKGLMWGVKG